MKTIKSNSHNTTVGDYSFTINTRLQMVSVFIDTLSKYTTCVTRSLKRGSFMLLVGGWLRWPGDGSWSQLTALLLGDCSECVCPSLRLAWWGVVFSEARWSQTVSWSDWIPLTSSPTCSYRWLLCDLQNVAREHAKCTAGTARANRSETSWRLIGLNWTELRCLLNCLEVDPSVNTARNNSCIVAIVRHHGNPVYRAVAWIPICVSVTWSPVLPTCERFPWEALTQLLLTRCR
jgi:hypothetical protein